MSSTSNEANADQRLSSIFLSKGVCYSTWTLDRNNTTLKRHFGCRSPSQLRGARDRLRKLRATFSSMERLLPDLDHFVLAYASLKTIISSLLIYYLGHLLKSSKKHQCPTKQSMLPSLKVLLQMGNFLYLSLCCRSYVP